MNAIIYSRIASSNQTNGNLLLENQTRKLVEYCASNEIKIIKQFEELGSGHNSYRKGWIELLDFVQKNEVDKVLVTNWNRLSRKFDVAVDMRNALLSMSVEVQSIDNSELSSLILLMNRP